MVVHQVKSAEEFKKALAENPKVLVDCFATWCGPCKAIAPMLDTWSNEYTDTTFIKIDVDELPELSQELGIRAMPTFILFKNNEKVEEVVGAAPPAILKALKL